MHRPAKLDKKLTKELKALSGEEDPYDTIIGKTLCTNDFYEGGCFIAYLIISLDQGKPIY